MRTDAMRARDRAYYERTKERRRALSLARYHANPEPFKLAAKRGVLKQKYGLSFEDYERMFHEQNGLCFICHEPQANRLLDVDHNHATNEVRRLLCNSCNRGLGFFKDKPQLLQKAADYLTAYGGSD